MTLDPMLLDILACPEDKGSLYYLDDEDSLYNPRLRRRYSIRDGIPVMLVDEAEGVDEPEHARLMAKVASERIRPTFEPAADGPSGPTIPSAGPPSPGGS